MKQYIKITNVLSLLLIVINHTSLLYYKVILIVFIYKETVKIS